MPAKAQASSAQGAVDRREPRGKGLPPCRIGRPIAGIQIGREDVADPEGLGSADGAVDIGLKILDAQMDRGHAQPMAI